MLMPFELKTLHAAKSFARNPYAWPGAYPMVAITADGGCLCSNCVKKEWRLVCAETFENTNCGFRIAGIDVNYENPDLYCDHCGAHMQPAHGED